MVRELRINDRIRAREVLLIAENGERLGIVPTTQALELAQQRGYDLVEVAPTAAPPVCRLLDYGKFKYEQAKKEKEARKHQHNVVLREVRMRPKIDTHDINFKIRMAEKLLQEGDKVKVSVLFRGREMVHPQLGKELLDKVYEELKEKASIEKAPSMEGRHMIMILTPSRQAKEKAKEQVVAETEDS